MTPWWYDMFHTLLTSNVILASDMFEICFCSIYKEYAIVKMVLSIKIQYFLYKKKPIIYH